MRFLIFYFLRINSFNRGLNCIFEYWKMYKYEFGKVKVSLGFVLRVLNNSSLSAIEYKNKNHMRLIVKLAIKVWNPPILPSNHGDHILFPDLHLLVFPYQALAEKIPKIPSKPFPLPPHYRPLTPPQKTPPPNPSRYREMPRSGTIPQIWLSTGPPRLLPLGCRRMLHQKWRSFRKPAQVASGKIPRLWLHHGWLGPIRPTLA